MRVTGNTLLEMERQIREDPMSAFVYERQKAKEEKYERVAYLETLVEQIREEERERKRKKEEKRAKKKKRRKEK